MWYPLCVWALPVYAGALLVAATWSGYKENRNMVKILDGDQDLDGLYLNVPLQGSREEGVYEMWGTSFSVCETHTGILT